MTASRTHAEARPDHGPARAVSRPDDRHEREASRAAEVVARGGSVGGWSFAAVPAQAPVQRQEAGKEKSEDEKRKEALKKAGEAALATKEGQALKEKVLADPVVKPVVDFVTSTPGLIASGAALAGGVVALGAAGKELPIQLPEIPGEKISPSLAGISAKITWEGPVFAPTSAGLMITVKEQGPKGKAKPDPIAADIARLKAQEEMFRKGRTYAPGSKEAEEERLLDEAVQKYVLSRSTLPGFTIPLTPPKPARKEEEQAPAQPAPATSSAETPAYAHVDGALTSGGRPLDPQTRRTMETGFRHDFSGVRIHDDARAAATAAGIDAAAFTVGQNIAFGTGRYSPATAQGRELLAHELAHTIQQRGASRKAPPIAPGSALETQAERAGRSAAASSAAMHPLGSAPLAVARQATSAEETRGIEDDRVEEARRKAVANYDWMLSIPPPMIDDDAPALIGWAEGSAARFAAPDTTDAQRGYIAMGLVRVFERLAEFEARAKREPDGALLYSGIAGAVPWSRERPRAVAELPLFAPAAVERWRRVADFAAAAQDTSGRRRRAKPVRIVSPTGRAVAVVRSPNTISFAKREGMSAATDEGQREIIWLYVAATHPGLTGDQIGWVVSRLGLAKLAGTPRLTPEWSQRFETTKVGDPVTVISDANFEREVSAARTSVPDERAFQLAALGQGARWAQGGVVLAGVTFGAGVAAFTGGAALGYLGALGGEVAMGGAVGGGAFVGGEAASFGSFAAAGARTFATDLYLNAPALYSTGMLYGGAASTGAGLGQQLLRIRSQGLHWSELPEFAANLLPLAERAVPLLGGGRGRSGASGGRAADAAKPDLVITPPRRDPVTGRVTANIADLANRRQYDAHVDPATQIGQIVDRRSRAVVGIIEGSEIRPPAAADRPARGPAAAPTPPGPAAQGGAPAPTRATPPGPPAQGGAPAPTRATPVPAGLARTVSPAEAAKTLSPTEAAKTHGTAAQPSARGRRSTIVGPPPAPARAPATRPAAPAPPQETLPPSLTAMSHDEVIAEYRRDPQSVFPAPSTDWFQQGIALDRASAQNPRHAVGIPPLTYRGPLPPAVRSGGVVIVDVERWPANLRSAIGLPAAGAQTQPSVAPPPKAPAPRGGAQQQRRPVPSNPLSPDEVIAQYRRNPQSVLRHPSSRAFKETLVLEGFDGDEFPIAVRGGEFVIIDVERWPAHLRAAIGLEEKPK